MSKGNERKNGKRYLLERDRERELFSWFAGSPGARTGWYTVINFGQIININESEKIYQEICKNREISEWLENSFLSDV